MTSAVAEVNLKTGNVPDWVAEFAADAARQRRRERVVIWEQRALIVVGVLATWQLLSALSIFKASLISSPADVASYLTGTLLEQGGFYADLRVTLQETLLGLIVGVLAAGIIGLLLGALPRTRRALLPLIVGLNAVPKVALVPVAIIWLGLGLGSKVLVAGLGVFFLVFFNVLGGVETEDRVLSLNLRMLGLNRFQVLMRVLAPTTGVWILAGMRMAISFALVGAIVTEYVGANAGIGFDINAAVNTLQVTRMMTLLLVVGVIGALLQGVVSAGERRFLIWR